MSDEINNDPVGGPQPIDSRKGRAILKRFAAVVGVTIGGVVTFAALVMPTRTQGVSRSARIAWQQRQNEVQKATATVPAGANATPAVPQSRATGPDNR